jgi:hypothetical protein
LFYFDNCNKFEAGARNFKQYFDNALSRMKCEDSLSDAGVKLLSDENFENEPIAEIAVQEVLDKYISTDSKSDKTSVRKSSMENLDNVREQKLEDLEEKKVVGHVEVDQEESGKESQVGESDVVEQKIEDEDDQKPDNDPDFCYRMPKKQKFEYNKRKDVILKTILRKCRRVLQDEFNELTGYLTNRKVQGHQFLRDCIQKYHDSIVNRPVNLDFLFYLGAMLYPQEMSRGVDCFIECDKSERVKQRKCQRAKIQKVHDALYRYSHEKMDFFVRIPELSYLFVTFYVKENSHENEDQCYMNGATEIFERCKDTLRKSGISI